MFSASRTPINRALRLLQTRKSRSSQEPRLLSSPRTDRVTPIKDDAIGELEQIYTSILSDRLKTRFPNVVLERTLLTRYNINNGQLAMVLARIAKEGWIERRGGYGWEFTEYLTTRKLSPRPSGCVRRSNRQASWSRVTNLTANVPRNAASWR